MVIKKILVPMDDSAYAENALANAVIIAKKLNAALTGVYAKDVRLTEGPWFKSVDGVLTSEPFFELGKSARDSFEGITKNIKTHFISTCKQNAISFTFETQKGLPSNVILEKSRFADMIVMGKKGRDARRLVNFLGSVCMRVIRHSDKPVFIVDYIPPRDMKKALICYAGVYYAKKTLTVAKYLALGMEMELSVLTSAATKSKAVQIQQEAKRYFADNGLKVNYITAADNLRKEVANIRNIEKFDMLIAGGSISKRYEDFRSLTLVEKILHENTISVFLVR